MTRQCVLFRFAQSFAWVLIAGLVATAGPAAAGTRRNAAGSFATVGGLPANNLAGWSDGSWQIVGDDGENGVDA